jgi:hypothetical protein
MTKEISKADHLIDQCNKANAELAEFAHEKLALWEPTDEQKEDLGNQFWKWSNEGMGEEYWPDTEGYPWFIETVIDDCSDDYSHLVDIFEQKGIEFE